MSIVYDPQRGMLLVLDGFTAVLPKGMTIAAIEKHLKELEGIL